ncbi:MAG TPA: hypothetical protein VEI97_20575 [bacterium]|nr:hypothetical protein [bacterium]
MATAPLHPSTEPTLPPAPQVRKRPTPGLTGGVVVVAALCFLMLMTSGTYVFVETLRVQNQKAETWPVARKRLNRSAPAPLPLSADQELAGTRDVPAAGQAKSGVGLTYLGDDIWSKYFPEVEQAKKLRPKPLGPEELAEIRLTPHFHPIWSALMDPESPVRLNYPLTRQQRRQLERMRNYEALRAAGFPEGPVTPEPLPEKSPKPGDRESGAKQNPKEAKEGKSQ